MEPNSIISSLENFDYIKEHGPVVPYDFQFDPDDPQFNEPRDPKYVMERRFLGEGQFGIVFMPAFPSDSGQEYPSMIGKVFYDVNHSQDEWKMIRRINHLTGNLAYPIERTFIPFPSNPSSVAEQDLLDFYKQHKDISSTPVPSVLPQHLMRYYGVDIEYYIESISPESISRADFVYILEKLFWGVKFLNKNGIVHQDIKVPNIVISNKKGLRIIDFGWAILEDDYYELGNEMLTINYVGVSPPENSILQFVLKNLTFDGLDYDKIDNEFVRHYQMNYPILDPNNKEFTEQFLDNLKSSVVPYIDVVKENIKRKCNLTEPEFVLFFDKFIELRKTGKLDTRDIQNEFPKVGEDCIRYALIRLNHLHKHLLTYWRENQIGNRYDIFSVGMVIDDLLRRKILIDEAKDDQGIVSLFKELVAGITRYSPLHRLDPDEAYRLVQQIKRRKIIFEREQQVSFLKSKFPGITETEIEKKLVRRFPFKVGEDLPRTKLMLQQFGGVNLKAINRDIFYLKGFK